MGLTRREFSAVEHHLLELDGSAADAAYRYTTAYCLEAATAQRQGEDVVGRVVDRAEIAERFDVTLDLLLRGLS